MKDLLINLLRQTLAFVTMPALIARAICDIFLQVRRIIDAKLAARTSMYAQLSCWGEEEV